MSVNAEYVDIKCESIKKSNSVQIAVPSEFPLSQENETLKVLSLNANLNNVESLIENDKIKVIAKVNWKVIYLDGEEIKNGDFSTDFQELFDNILVENSTEYYPILKIIDYEFSLKGNVIKASVAVDVSFVYQSEQTENALTSQQGTFTKNKEIETLCVTSFDSGVISAEEEFSIGQEVGEILYFDSKPYLNTATSNDGAVVIEGEVLNELTFKTQNGIETKCFTVPFVEEMKCSGASDGEKNYTVLSLKNNKLTISGEGASTTILLECLINANVITFGKNYYSVTEDIYSTTNDISIKKGSIRNTLIDSIKCFDEKIIQSTTLDKNRIVRSIIAVYGGRLNIGNVNVEQGVLFVDGAVATDVLYYDYDGVISSMNIEIPFSIKKGIIELKPNGNVILSASVGLVKVRVRRDNELEVSCDLYFNTFISSTCEINYIKDIEIGEICKGEKAGISIYFSKKGDTVWEIGKALKADAEAVKKANPDLPEVLSGTEKVLILRLNDLN